MTSTHRPLVTYSRLLGALLAATLGFVPNVGAQSTPYGYHWTPSDTLRYSELTHSRVEMQMPGGTVLVRSEHDARIAVTALGRDTLAAWYEGLRLVQEGPGTETQSPSTAQLIGAPFMLTFDSHSPLRTSTTPAIPVDIAALTDLSRQFDDFFITLPRTKLAIGTRWADTVQTDRPARPTDTFSGRSVRDYQVVRDTTADGAPAFIVAVTQSVTLDASSRIEEQQMTVTTQFAGEDTGEVIFVPSQGRLHARTRAGKLAGSLTLTGPSGEMSVPQSYDYTSSIAFLP